MLVNQFIFRTKLWDIWKWREKVDIDRREYFLEWKCSTPFRFPSKRLDGFGVGINAGIFGYVESSTKDKLQECDKRFSLFSFVRARFLSPEKPGPGTKHWEEISLGDLFPPKCDHPHLSMFLQNVETDLETLEQPSDYWNRTPLLCRVQPQYSFKFFLLVSEATGKTEGIASLCVKSVQFF
ncbi:hypothetical protein AVEN_142537-1 [Araneus ventricosus]|uniref:Uncharacterized protein n=1 Tax=Araneus ventricosus TaxID=182803 RepID=A0A4Y2CH10_ARAVE|nr:hypothetical protein AVEN_142537-1 [Araneus ventricosus]